MCSIFGYIPDGTLRLWMMKGLMRESLMRGRDGIGYAAVGQEPRTSLSDNRNFIEALNIDDLSKSPMIGNCRAEPTTEYVKDKNPRDQQPYRIAPWTIVHNGTIANDHDLRTHKLETSIDSAAIVEILSKYEVTDGSKSVFDNFSSQIFKLRGSFAILATHDDHPNVVFYACNYRPIWFNPSAAGLLVSSSRNIMGVGAYMTKPYSIGILSSEGVVYEEGLLPESVSKTRSLVICSGGLDSTVAATKKVRDGHDVELIHFMYGSRAEGPEIKAVQDVATALDVPLTLFPLKVYDPSDSPLLRADSDIAGGEEGAEFAYEWVPARNLVMLSVATAYAEAKGFDEIVLGNNLEEAGAYPDNEPEFIDRFNDILPFAVGDGKQLSVDMPVGNLMKHEIVALGIELGAPMDKTWSCYRSGETHCGTCGPCFMRRTAFEINNEPEVIDYLK